MKQSSFIASVRQYASLARRLGVSYAEPVNALAQLHQDWLAANVSDPAEYSQKQAEMRDFLDREYKTVDPTFTLDIIPF